MIMIFLGRYIAFQNYRGSFNAGIDGFQDKYYYGSRPVSPLMPSFRNVYKQETDFLRGYLVFWGAYRRHAEMKMMHDSNWREILKML